MMVIVNVDGLLVQTSCSKEPVLSSEHHTIFVYTITNHLNCDHPIAVYIAGLLVASNVCEDPFSGEYD